MSPLARVVLKSLLLPPNGPSLLALFAWLAGCELLGAAALFGLALLATPRVGHAGLALLECHPPWRPTGGAPGAIVVLDAGRLLQSVGDGFSAGAVIKPGTLARLRTAAEIARDTGLPILASGDGAGRLMADVLRDDLGIEVRWLDTASRDTAESARRAAEILGVEGVERVVLVTHGWHLPRAILAFERAGLEVEPAPATATGADRWERGLLAWIPGLRGLQASHVAAHELLGLVVYRLRARLTARSSR